MSDGASRASAKPDTTGLFRALFMHMAEGVALHEITVDGAGQPAGYRIVEVNPQYEGFMGKSRDDLIGKLASEVFGPGDPRRLDLYSQVLSDDRPARVETHCPFTDRHFEISVSPMGSGFFATIMVEVTERKRHEKERQKSQAERQRLEQQLLQSQKMESVGLLAGGVAHDFNNLLTVILSCAEMLGERVGPNEQQQALLSEVTSAAQRAADLTRQLLAFSRRQVLQPRVLDLNNVVVDMSRMLGRMLGEHVQVSLMLGAQVGAVFADPGQLHQIIVNLAVNARDAMPQGGTLTFETVDVPAAEAARLVDAAPGSYVALVVRDTGLGMDEATRARIFEPFFTTKGELGTGLGLATVYGIVTQSGGQIVVSSEPGLGTTFKIFLPRAEPGLPAVAPSAPRLQSIGGRETVLLVEDEQRVRAVLKRVLVGAGYDVLEAANAEDASLVHEGFGGTIHALVTDVVMPGKTGPELARHLTSTRPALKVLYMSGYAPNARQLALGIDSSVSFLQKPIMPPQLLSMLRDVLGQPS